MRFRLRTLLIVAGLCPVPFALLSASSMSLPLRDFDKIGAARNLISWLVDRRPVPGFDEPPVNGHFTRAKESFVVACSFAQARTQLSEDARVRLVPVLPHHRPLKQSDESAAYICIRVKSESRWLLGLEIENDYGLRLGAQCYRFEFRRKVWGLRGRGELLWDY